MSAKSLPLPRVETGAFSQWPRTGTWSAWPDPLANRGFQTYSVYRVNPFTGEKEKYTKSFATHVEASGAYDVLSSEHPEHWFAIVNDSTGLLY